MLLVLVNFAECMLCVRQLQRGVAGCMADDTFSGLFLVGCFVFGCVFV